jgi:galactokinase
VAHRNVDGQYEQRRRGCERAARLLGVATLRDVADAASVDGVEDALQDLAGDESYPLARHVVSEMHRVDCVVRSLQTGQVGEIGPSLDASHRSLRDDFAVSCVELDLAVDSARADSALGARMTGGGFGGSAIALVPAGSEVAVAAAIDDAFARAGSARPAFLLARAAGPAGRVA